MDKQTIIKVLELDRTLDEQQTLLNKMRCVLKEKDTNKRDIERVISLICRIKESISAGHFSAYKNPTMNKNVYEYIELIFQQIYDDIVMRWTDICEKQQEVVNRVEKDLEEL